MSDTSVDTFDPVNSGPEKKKFKMQLRSTTNGSNERGQVGCNKKGNKYLCSQIYAKNYT